MAPSLIQEVAEDHHSPVTTIELNSVEQTLKRLLLDVAVYIDETPSSSDAQSQVTLPEELAKQKLSLRFAGGWVRDKLLGTQTNDIDVAINKMTGYHFGLRLKEYLEISGNLEKYGLDSIAANDKQSQKAGSTDKSKTVGGLHRIEANPEKSKNLETTTMRILGLDIDLVNLRKETYSDDSRNPTIEFGTAEEDAIRRDATVNAMFYNINTDKIEDLTGKGRDDMRRRVLRTPLEPYQTFKDDPLRVLRLIRFASRLGYTIDSDALNAMRNPDIKDALRRKISRERVGIEIEKSLKGPDPHKAMRLVLDLGLYDTIFSDPAISVAEHYQPDVTGLNVVIDTLRDVLDNNDDETLARALVRDKDEQLLAWQLAALIPYRDAPHPASELGRKAPPPVSVQVAREGVKSTSKTCDVIQAAVRHQNEISAYVDKVFEQKRRSKPVGDDVTTRDSLGMAVRKWGSSWRSQVMYSLLVDISDNLESVDVVHRKYTLFVNHLRALDLLDVCSFKPLMDGKALAKALNTPPGPWMKDALDVVMAWQLRHPHIRDPEGAIEEVKQHQGNGELTSDLVRHFLKLTIRPLFIKANPHSVTDQGRKVISTALPKKMTVENTDDSVNKPWKHERDSHVLDLLRWAVHSLDPETVENVWPLVIPPVLTLVDDWETKYKRVGVELLRVLLQSTPPSLLQKTGLGEVFEEAVMPCLTYLPTVTPEDESTALLSAVYPTLRTLAVVRYPQTESSIERIKTYDAIVRRGIIYGCVHCSSYPNILCVLFQQLCITLDDLGIDSVKHIKYLLPILNETLSHPLASSSPRMLKSAVLALQSVIRNGWPRMSEHRAEVLQGLSLCWVQHVASQDEEQPTLSASESSQSKDLPSLLKETVEMLMLTVTAVATPGGIDFRAECASLVAVEPRLKGLLVNVRP